MLTKQKLPVILLLGLFFLTGIGCITEIWKDNSYSPEDRADDLLKELTLEEKVSLMVDHNAPIERLGIMTHLAGDYRLLISSSSRLQDLQ